MNDKKSAGKNIKTLLGMLASEDGSVRLKARESLVSMGNPVVSSIIKTLQSSRLGQVRWEAAKTLNALENSSSIPALVKALEDTDADVSWLAGESLKKFERDAWVPLLRALIKNGADSALLRQGAHHVLCKQKAKGFNELLAALVNALESSTASESTGIAAYDILKRIKAKA